MTRMTHTALHHARPERQAAANDRHYPRHNAPDTRGYHIAPVRDSGQQAIADTLVRRRFAWRGYNTEALAFGCDAGRRLTLAAWFCDELIATLTLLVDSNEGLQTEALYGRELERLRRPGRRLCEVTRLAVDPDFSCPRLLRALFSSACEHGRSHFAASDVVIGVNPRHAAYYQRRMGFRQVGARRHYPRVDAPVVLLHQTLGGLLAADAIMA